MNYFNKRTDSKILQEGWTYNVQSQRPQIRQELLREQKGFCAYTEDFVDSILYAKDIEHFDNRLKNTDSDNYWNWFAVGHVANMKKPRSIERFLPILHPNDASIVSRVEYKNGQFSTVIEDDLEAQNLIDFLTLNAPELDECRMRHIARMKDVRELWGNDELFIDYMYSNPAHLSFITVLQAELGLNFDVDISLS